MPSHPTVFISYSWDDEVHKEWVRQLAARLRADGVDAPLDRWHAVPGDQLPEFIEREIRDNDYVLIICTPKYKDKSDKRIGGVGYEGDIMTGEVFTKQNHRKFCSNSRVKAMMFLAQLLLPARSQKPTTNLGSSNIS
jgi:hypothetical protein